MLDKQENVTLAPNNGEKIDRIYHKEQKYVNPSPCIAALTALLLHFSLGICQGFSAVLIPQLESPDSELHITPADASWIASTSVITMPVGALCVGVSMELFGRKRVIQMAFIPLIVGWTIIATSNSILILCIGRLITGFAVGMDPAVVIYIAEINIPKFRSILLSLTGPSMLLGTLTVYLLGHLLYWRVAAVVLACFSGLCFFALFTIPESPVWLVSRNNIDGATASLRRLRVRNQNIHFELEELLQAKLCKVKSSEKTSYLEKIRATKAWKPFLIMTTFFFLQQFAGTNVILYYAVNFYQAFGTTIDSFLSSLIYIALSMVFSFVFSSVVGRYNRRTLVIVSAIGLCVTSLAAAVYEFATENASDKPIFWFPLVCMWMNVSFGVIGVYTLPWLMSGELFPTQVRGVMTGLLWMTVYLYIFITVKIYPFMVSYIKLYGVLGAFAVSSFLCIVLGKYFLPETRGKTLIEIEKMW